MGQRDSKVSMVDDTTPAESTPARPADVEDVAPAGAAPLDIPKLLNILNSEEKPHYMGIKIAGFFRSIWGE